MRLTVYVVIAIASAVVLGVSRGSGNAAALSGGILTGTVLPIIDIIVANKGRIATALASARIGDDLIRISASYLFKIKIDDRYLLIRGNRHPEQFQPVGGVFKMLPEGRAFLHTLRAQDDNYVPIDDASRDDLRIRIPGKHLPEFLRWYDSRAGRESDAWREFYEELIRPGILSSENFPHVFSRHLRRVQPPIRFSPWAQSKELLVADIYELLPSPTQEAEIRRLGSSQHPSIIWATESEIHERGSRPGRSPRIQISQTAEWTL